MYGSEISNIRIIWKHEKVKYDQNNFIVGLHSKHSHKSRDARLFSKVGKIDPKLDKSAIFFLDLISVHFDWNLIWKIPGFVPFGPIWHILGRNLVTQAQTYLTPDKRSSGVSRLDSDWHQIWKIWDFLRLVFCLFWLGEPKWT